MLSAIDEGYSASQDVFQQGARQLSGFTTVCPQQGKPLSGLFSTQLWTPSSLSVPTCAWIMIMQRCAFLSAAEWMATAHFKHHIWNHPCSPSDVCVSMCYDKQCWVYKSPSSPWTLHKIVFCEWICTPEYPSKIWEKLNTQTFTGREDLQ